MHSPMTINNYNYNHFTRPTNAGKVGFIKTLGDGVVKASGLKEAAFGSLVHFPEADATGFICNLNFDSVDILILDRDRYVKAGMVVIGKTAGLRVPVTTALLGRVINPLGEPIDGLGELGGVDYTAAINIKAPGIVQRERVGEPVFTGIKVIDSLIPIGKGQRELVIGDKGTGKTSICFDTILNQKSENEKNSKNKLYCIYVSIGQKKSSVRTMFNNLIKLGAMEHVVIVNASASDSAALQYLAPYTGCAIAEYFMNLSNSLIIYDDLTQHAMSYRQISLLLRRPPGREAYPGDVFYLHSRLLERAAKLNKNYGSGSLTALPVVETLFGDVTAYIPTNVISITDGQIFLDKKLFMEGIIPALNVGLSVSRVGSAAQLLSMKTIARSLKLELAQYNEVKDFVKFGSDLDEETINLIKRGEILTSLLTQKRFSPVPIEEQVLILYAGLKGYLDKINKEDLFLFIEELLNFAKSSNLFKVHYNLLRYNNYFSRYGEGALHKLLQYFTYSTRLN